MKPKPKTPISIRVGYAIRKRREGLNVSQEEFAAMFGVHRTYYAKIERGELNVQIDTLERLCNRLGVRPHEIMLDAEKDPPKAALILRVGPPPKTSP